MTIQPRILSIASAAPPFRYTQQEILQFGLDHILGSGWQERPELASDAHLIERLFTASRVRERQSAVDIEAYYQEMTLSTGERMATYRPASYQLGHAAMQQALENLGGKQGPQDISDFVVVSCTGYSAPGLDIQLARDFGMRRDVRRLIVGHMGCFGALAGLRQCLAISRAYPEAVVAMLSVELSSLHFAPSLDPETLTGFALFGDAAAAVILGQDPEATGPELVDTYCAADFAASEQMTWHIADQGFVMTLSPRVPITLRRNILEVVDQLLAPNGLTKADVAHWIIHPGGPSILESIQSQLDLSPEQMAFSWQVLQDHGNCSSATVLLILEEVLHSGQATPGEWGVMMAFGPGLTLETTLLRF